MPPQRSSWPIDRWRHYGKVDRIDHSEGQAVEGDVDPQQAFMNYMRLETVVTKAVQLPREPIWIAFIPWQGPGLSHTVRGEEPAEAGSQSPAEVAEAEP